MTNTAPEGSARALLAAAAGLFAWAILCYTISIYIWMTTLHVAWKACFMAVFYLQALSCIAIGILAVLHWFEDDTDDRPSNP